MKTPLSFKRIAISLSVGVVIGAIAGALLGYMYDRLNVPQTIFILPYLNIFGMGVCIAVLGGLLGALIGIFNLRRLWGTLLGLAAGLLFVLFWLTFEVRVPTEPDEALIEAIVPIMTVLGLLISSISRLVSPHPDVPVKDGWQNKILTQ